MDILAGIFAVLVFLAGWFYLFQSRGGQSLGGVEQQDINRRRIRLRRIGGGAMIALAICFAAGVFVVDTTEPTLAFLWVWSAAMALLVLIIALALMDLRLTWQLRKKRATDEHG